MSPALLLKARRMAVMPALDGSYRVGGDTDVHTIYYSRFEKRMVCDCKASANRRSRCSHDVAVDLHIAATAADKAN